MLNFTVGPVQSGEQVCRTGGEQVPYFRTPEFSKIMLENERLMKKFSGAGESARAVFLTGSGTAAMEAAVMNLFTAEDKVLIVNGGSFGARFVKICQIHGIPWEEISLSAGQPLREEELNAYRGGGYTGFLVNVHETSTGVLYDMEMISRFCKEEGLFLVADAISSFLADPFEMEKWGVDGMITGSQKALACPPGVSILVLSERAIQRVEKNPVKCLYLNLKDALKDMERGQTPFTPAVGILRQIHVRLKEIEKIGLEEERRKIEILARDFLKDMERGQTPFTPAVGILRQIHVRLKEIEKIGLEEERRKIEILARDFRDRIRELPFDIASVSMSNAVTPLHPRKGSAYDIFVRLKEEYQIWVCPNGGELANQIFRVGHIGALTLEDNKKLIAALRDMEKRGLL